MNIVFISEFFPVSDKVELTGGVEARCFFIAKFLAKKHNVTVVTSRAKGTPEQSVISGIKVIRLGNVEYSQTKGKLRRIKFALKTRKFLKNYVKNNHVDIIEGYNFFSYYGVRRYNKHIRTFATYHDVWIGRWVKVTGSVLGILGEVWEKYLLWMLKKNKAHFIVNSRFTMNNLIKAGINKKDVDFVYNGVDLNYYAQIKAEKQKDPTICFVGRHVKYKKVDDLIRAIAIVKEKIPNIKCRIAGDGPEKKTLMALAFRLGLDENVKFLGFLKDYKEIVKLIKSSHLLCLPSLIEGFGMVTVEAMTCGTPYVNSDIDPTTEITDNGVGGLLYSKGDYKALADSIILILTDNKLYNEKVAQGIEFAKRYDWNKLVQQVDRIYQD